jgi:hypothetical protein
VQTRTQHVALEHELESLRSLAASRQYVNLSDHARKNMEIKLAETEQRWNTKRLELNDLVYKLVDSEFWDAALAWPGLSGEPKDRKVDIKGKGRESEGRLLWSGHEAKEAQAEERFKELRVIVWQVRDKVTELYEMMDELKGVPADPPNFNGKEKDTGGSGRPTKRRRTSDLTSSIPEDELEGINDKLIALDGRVADLENTMTQFDNEVLTELDRRMEERFQELSLGPSGGDTDDRMVVDGPSTSLDTGQTTATGEGRRNTSIAERVQLIENDILGIGEEISTIALEIADIITKAKQTDEEVTRLKEENEALRGRVETVSLFSTLPILPKLMCTLSRRWRSSLRRTTRLSKPSKPKFKLLTLPSSRTSPDPTLLRHPLQITSHLIPYHSQCLTSSPLLMHSGR